MKLRIYQIVPDADKAHLIFTFGFGKIAFDKERCIGGDEDE